MDSCDKDHEPKEGETEADIDIYDTTDAFSSPCLICGLNVAEFPNRTEDPDIGKESGVKDDDDESDIFRCLLELFGLQQNRRIRWHDDDGELPFCEDCKNQLKFLIKLQAELRKGYLVVKERLEGSENRFQTKRLYQKDKRYYQLRRQILGGKTGLLPSDDTPQEKSPPPTRNSSTPNKISTEIRTSMGPIPPENPVYAGEGFYEEIIKVEVEEEEVNDCEYRLIPEENSMDVDYSSLDKAGCISSESTNDIGSDMSDSSFTSPIPTPRKSKIPKKKTEKTDKVGGIYGLITNNSQKRVKAQKKVLSRTGKKIRGGYNKSKIFEDPVAGICRYLNITFEKIDIGKYKCLDCMDVVTSHSTIKNHVVRAHTDRFVCKQCGQHKASLSDLNKHVREVHERKSRKPPPKTKECHICGKPFGHKAAMEFHIATHYSEEDKQEAAARGKKIIAYKEKCSKVQCVTCGALFSNVTWLKKHEKINHSTSEQDKNEVTRMCPECGKSFSEAYFNQHMQRYHSGLDVNLLKPFVCSYCDKRFFTSPRLIQHKLTHTGERPHKCSICDKDFTSKPLLKHHIMRNHQEKRPHQCTLCSSSFVTLTHLKRHVSGVHEGKKQSSTKSAELSSGDNTEVLAQPDISLSTCL